MELTKENIAEWKAELDQIMEELYGKKYSDCNSDETWLEMYEGQTPQDAKDDDIYYSSQN